MDRVAHKRNPIMLPGTYTHTYILYTTCTGKLVGDGIIGHKWRKGQLVHTLVIMMLRTVATT